MTANVSGINPNHTFLLTFAFLVRWGDYRSATLYRILTDDLKYCADYHTNQQLADRLGATRNQYSVAMEKLIDFGVVLPIESAGPSRSVVLPVVPTPRFIMWSLQTLVPEFEATRAQLVALKEPVSSFMFTEYGYDHQQTPLHPQLLNLWGLFASKMLPPSLAEPGYVVAAAGDSGIDPHKMGALISDGCICSCSCSCSILTTKTSTTTTTDTQVPVDAVLPDQATPGKVPVFRKTARAISRRKPAHTLAALKNSYASRYRSLADLKLIEPERYAEIEVLVGHYNRTFSKAVPFNPYAYAAMREALVEGQVTAAQIKQAFEVAARDPFWTKQSYTTLLKPDRIASFATTKHDRYARNQAQQPDANTETREF